MVQENLLRHIFKRGLLSNKFKKTARQTGDNNDRLLVARTTEGTNETAFSDALKTQDGPGAGLTVKIEAQQQTTRGIDTRPSSFVSCSSDSETIHTGSIHMLATYQGSYPPTVSVRELLHAVMEEADVATTTHMETLDTTLVLLDAIKGLSATVDVLKREMEHKKRVCEEMRSELLSFKELVTEMGFVE